MQRKLIELINPDHIIPNLTATDGFDALEQLVKMTLENMTGD